MALVGLDGRIVEVEADIGAGLPRTVLVGLPDSALYQARDRCKAAVSNSGQAWPIALLNRGLDLTDVVGQVKAKWTCEVAAAGRHHMPF